MEVGESGVSGQNAMQLVMVVYRNVVGIAITLIHQLVDLHVQGWPTQYKYVQILIVQVGDYFLQNFTVSVTESML